MYGSIKKFLSEELSSIEENGLLKKERIITSPQGAQVTVQNGDKVVVHRIPKQSWIDLLTMAQWGWNADAYDIYYERKVKGVNGNTLTLDAPMVDIIDTTYATGEVMRYASNRIENIEIL